MTTYPIRVQGFLIGRPEHLYIYTGVNDPRLCPGGNSLPAILIPACVEGAAVDMV